MRIAWNAWLLTRLEMKVTTQCILSLWLSIGRLWLDFARSSMKPMPIERTGFNGCLLPESCCDLCAHPLKQITKALSGKQNTQDLSNLAHLKMSVGNLKQDLLEVRATLAAALEEAKQNESHLTLVWLYLKVNTYHTHFRSSVCLLSTFWQ